jgi:hypothetical protein
MPQVRAAEGYCTPKGLPLLLVDLDDGSFEIQRAGDGVDAGGVEVALVRVANGNTAARRHCLCFSERLLSTA